MVSRTLEELRNREAPICRRLWDEEELPYIGFIEKWNPSTSDIGSLRSLQYTHTHTLTDGRKDFALISWQTIETSGFGNPISLAM